MTNMTRKDIINAYEALDRLEKAAWKGSQNDYEEEYHTQGKDLILKLLPPKPELTMEDIDWDPDDYYLVEAEHPDYGTVIMVEKSFYTGYILVVAKDESGVRCINVEPKELTLIGK